MRTFSLIMTNAHRNELSIRNESGLNENSNLRLTFSTRIKQAYAFHVECHTFSKERFQQIFLREYLFLPRILVTCTEIHFPDERLYFLASLVFAITINKAYGQSVEAVGVDVKTPHVFISNFNLQVQEFGLEKCLIPDRRNKTVLLCIKQLSKKGNHSETRINVLKTFIQKDGDANDARRVQQEKTFSGSFARSDSAVKCHLPMDLNSNCEDVHSGSILAAKSPIASR